MKNPWKPTLVMLGLLSIATPEARSQIALPMTVTGAASVAATDGTHQIHATLGQSAIGYAAGESTNAALGFWQGVPEAKTSTQGGEEPRTGAQPIAVHASPNPFSGSTEISLSLSRSCRISLVLYDLLGKPVQTLLDAEQPEGTYTLNLSVADLPSGRYTLTVTGGEERQTIPLLLVR